MHIGKKIKERRQELQWSQRELAKRMGYTNNSTIAKIEQGKVDVSQTRLVQFCRVLNVNMIYFLGEGYIDKEDAEFINSLGTIHPKEELPPEIEAINTLVGSSGRYILKTNGNYFLDEVGMLEVDEISDLVNTISAMALTAVEMLSKKKTNELRMHLSKKDNKE